MPAGRPEDWTIDKSLAFVRSILDWMKADESRIYWLEFVIMEADQNKDTVNYLRRKFSGMKSEDPEVTSKLDELSRILKTIDNLQELRLLKKEGKGEIKSMFILKNLHNYADKQEVKTENVNYNYDPGDIREKTADQLQELLNAETNTSH